MHAGHLGPKPRSLALAIFVSAGCALASGCAQSDPVAPGSGGGGTGGAGGGETNAPASTTTGNDCSEEPCKLVSPQCGCDDGFGCTLNAEGERVCLAAGAVAPGQACSATALCSAGSVCVGYGEGLYACASFCEDDTSCDAPGGKCIVPLVGSEVLLCSEDCDLISSAGCSVAGLSCQFNLAGVAPYTLCAPSGTQPAQGTCLETSECLPGHACLPTTAGDSRCFEWCNVESPVCEVGFSCGALEIDEGVPLVIGDVSYGACNPN